jgi:bacteriophage N4 adsorption protein B
LIISLSFGLLDHWVAALLAPLAVWILVSGLDDFIITIACLWPWRKRFVRPSVEDLRSCPERRIAILVPLWREDIVIGQMLERNVAAIRYRDYDVFAGVYPNDKPTIRAVNRVSRRHPSVHLAVNTRNGPTSKGDCLNVAYRRMREYEAAQGVRYEIVTIHDAEDVIHPDSLRLINFFSRGYEMIQVPVLPLPTALGEITHGVYCDEFAEYQSKDIPVRQMLGGFLPSNGVGTGFARGALERLAERRGGTLFDPGCLTEDYETGFLLHEMGCRQMFLPLSFEGGEPVATREYFPHGFRTAVRQRSRWVAGITLQGWERHRWRVPLKQVYWLFRDRKGLIGNLLSPVAVLACFYGLGTALAAKFSGTTWEFGAHLAESRPEILGCTFAISVVQLSARTVAAARIYGWRFAACVPVRTLWATAVNFAATVLAIRQFIVGRMRKQTLAWRKTEHVYPAQPMAAAYTAVRFSEPG